MALLPRPATFYCDHYWLCRRGGKCPHCGATFTRPGS